MSPSRRITAHMEPSRSLPAVSGLPLKAALLLGFGATVAVWVLAGYQFTQRLADLEADTGAISNRFLRAQELLSTTRAQILLGSVFVHDALLDPDPSAADTYRARFEEASASAMQSLQQYVPVLDSPDERARVEGLRREIDDFHRAMLDVFASDRRQWGQTARQLLQQRVVPKRELVLQVSNEVQAMNRLAFVQERVETSDLYREAQHRAWLRLGAALAGSVGIGLLATFYAGRLESRVGRQRLRDLQLTSDLHRLSARLATAQEDERRTIARELHDEVGQSLMAIKMELAAAQRDLPDRPAIVTQLEEARAMTEGALQTIRNLSHLLHPSVLDDLGLAPAIESYLTTFSRRHGVRAELLHDKIDRRFPPDIEVAVYRIIQEALTNVAKHANATSCRVYLHGLTSSLLVTIEDDGIGFDPGELSRVGRGLGLVGIRERVAQHRGTMAMETAPGQGTRLTIELPAAARASEAER